jgi:DNA-binding transcriptional ArsR family regulator
MTCGDVGCVRCNELFGVSELSKPGGTFFVLIVDSWHDTSNFLRTYNSNHDEGEKNKIRRKRINRTITIAATRREPHDSFPEEKRSLTATVVQDAAALGTLHSSLARHILNHMVQYMQTRLDGSFAALSDATRRGILEQLGRSDASTTELAEKFHMTLTGMKKHVGVLEEAGLVTTEKVGRVRTCKLGLRRLEEETAWLERYRQLWDSRFDELDKVVEELKRKEEIDGHNKR